MKIYNLQADFNDEVIGGRACSPLRGIIGAQTHGRSNTLWDRDVRL
jgi:hypothetical protein